ncbi:esterase family protein [Macrococcus brunensis]|uniref:Esterase family protein n=1 Tax=Macrococcus brunensis TaxID=198483 RepID=A0A4R6BAP9_9STAP|nr:alpha/beta hydrolase-fold protein [Macrococcus brunensis]TDL93371.1 esterase family protein [Macrococcus brunensis]
MNDHMFKRGLVTPYEINSPSLNRSVKLGIYLPENYSALKEHAVIMAFDGQDFSQLGQLHRQYEELSTDVTASIIIFIHYPDVATRSKEYHPDSPHKMKMIDFVTTELESFVTEHFAVSDQRLLMGDSLAASIALSISLHDAQFNQAALFSPMITEAIHQELEALRHPVKYVQLIGKEEDAFKLMSGEIADFLTPNRSFHSELNNRGIEHEYRELDGGHTWKTWKPEIASILLYFLGE